MKNKQLCFHTDPTFLGMKQALLDGNMEQVSVTGLSPIHQAHYIASFFLENGERPIFVLAESEAFAGRLVDDINTFIGESIASVFGERDYLFRNLEKTSQEYEWERLGTLSKLLRGTAKIIVASTGGSTQFTITKENLEKHTLYFKVGESYEMEELSRTLIRAGYVRESQVTGLAEFSVRGGIFDVFPPGFAKPVRLEFWGGELDSIHTFSPEDQRREESLTEVYVTPAQEVILTDKEALANEIEARLHALKGKEQEKILEHTRPDIEHLRACEEVRGVDKYLPLLETATIFDYFGEDATFFYLNLGNIRESMTAQEALHNDDVETLLQEGLLFPGLDRYYETYTTLLLNAKEKPVAYLEPFARTLDGVRLTELMSAETLTLSVWSGEYHVLFEDLRDYFMRGFSVILYAGTEKSRENIKETLVAEGFSVSDSETGVMPGSVLVLAGSLSGGAEYPKEKLAVLTYAKVQSKKRRSKKHKSAELIRNVSDLSKGDYIVHVSHGIGIYEGIQTITADGLVKDYIRIRYAGTDVLYVPVTQLDLVSKYIGPRENSGMKLHSLSGGAWEKARARVKLAATDMAKELIALYAKRQEAKGHAFAPDGEWQRELEARFEYEETDDQLRSISEIKADMEKPSPMDRLLCGDVGFGKTEVALRAVFKCVMGGKQCAFLAPTTILAWQHFQTLERRFADFPIEIAHLSRFSSTKERAEVVKKLRTGEIDVVIGTHSIVQKSVVFRDLGLAIIDEEQRFGVKHKESFKERAPSVDVLTLSATPIPRTLSMAMSGIRDMSVLEEPPGDRQPIQTYVLEHSEPVLFEAITKELRRGGQVYYLHNRVDDLDAVVGKLQQAFPDAVVAMSHGRMGEEELSGIWTRLTEGEIDILVCTTIIETGIDVPNCNTLIVENADRLGLAQLYQIRGRVGRSTRRAYAYFTFQRDKVMTEVASKRLTAIKEFTNFGAGFQIAMRDLEIRGAGSILGGSQHGHMEAVGYDLYIKILNEAVAKEKGETYEEVRSECLIDIQMDAHIPECYISADAQRIDVYKRIALIETEEDSFDVTDELIDRYGEPPTPVQGLIDIALIRNRAARLGVTEINEKTQDTILFYLNEHIRFEEVAELIRSMAGRALFNASGRPYLSIKRKRGQSQTELILEVLSHMNLQYGTSKNK